MEMGETPNQIEPDEVVSFLDRKGAVALLCEFGTSSTQYSRLAEGMAISRTTLTKRLEEARELGLIEQIEYEGRGTSHAYVFTESGAELRVYLNQSGATEKHRLLKQLRREFDEEACCLREWVAENGIKAADDDHGGGYLRQLKAYGSE